MTNGFAYDEKTYKRNNRIENARIVFYDKNGQEVHGWDFKIDTFIRVAIENKEVLSALFNTTVDKLYEVEPLKLEINED